MGVVSLAKVLGAIGLVWGVIAAVAWIVAGLLGAASPGLAELVISVLVGVLYGVVGGAITAVVYNTAARFVGGIDVELS